MRRPILLALLAVAAMPTLSASAAERPVVVELFTSQSCSSCPPAEALLGQLAREGRDVLPLAFHVTYWDHLDWRDTFALPAATHRQAAYAARLGGGSYTPEAVIDGEVGLVGSEAGSVRRRHRPREGCGHRRRTRDGGAARGSLVVTLGAGRGTGTVTLVGFDPSHTTKVARGENAGRTITQANIVRAVQSIGRWSGQAATLETPVPAGADAAVLVQGADGRILGAARLGAAS